MFFFKKCYVEPRPYGVVAVDLSLELSLCAGDAARAGRAAGGQHRGAEALEVTVATGLLLERLIERVPEMKPFVRVLHGDGRVGAALVQSDPDYIFLTGSTLTGRTVARSWPRS